MIVNRNGRSHNVRTPQEVEATLKKDIASLTEEERETLQVLLKEMEQEKPEESPDQLGLFGLMKSAEYKRELVDIRTFVLDPYYLGNTCDTIYPVLLDDLERLFTGDYHEAVICLHPNTVVPLLDGTEKTISCLAEEWNKNPVPFWIYSVDSQGRVVPALADNPRCTGWDDYYKVTLEDGTSFIGNSRHQMVMRTGEKRMIQDMAAGDSLMPFNTELSKKTKGRRIEGYELVLDPASEELVYTHAMVCEQTQGPVDSKRFTIHHVDFTKSNNCPDNLQVMTWEDHQRLHAKSREEFLAARPDYLGKLRRLGTERATNPDSPLRRGHRKFMASEEGKRLSARNLSKAIITAEDRVVRGRAASIARWAGPNGNRHREEAATRMKKRNANEGLASKAGTLAWKLRSEESRRAHSCRVIERNKEGRLRRTDITADIVLKAVADGAVTWKAAVAALGCSETRIKRVLTDAGIDYQSIFTKRRNHFVVSIRKIGRGPVYCMTVPSTTNFAICTSKNGYNTRNGVFSSNTGSIGIGKTFLASIGVCRTLYELSCMKDPHKSFGLAPDSNISIVCISVNETLATKVAFENIATKIKASPYFQENFAFEPTKKELRFPSNIWVAARASTDTSALGLNPIASLLDEVNFLPKLSKRQMAAQSGALTHYDHAETIYNSIKRRMKSRFERRGRLPGMLFIVSSKNTLDDFTARRIREAKTDPHVYIVDKSLWEVKPDAYSTERFHVLCGNEQTPSRILEPEDDVEEIAKSIPEGVTLLPVPIDFRHDFERDLEGSIRDIGGVSTVSMSPFIQRRDKIIEAIDHSREHPFTSLEYDASRGGEFMWDRMVGSVEELGFGGVRSRSVRPILNPNAARHLHIDPSVRSDATGLVMAHIGGFKGVVRRADDGRQYTENAPVYIVDLVLRIVPPIGGEIVLGDVRRIVYELSAHGYTLTSVSIDSWNSVEAIQQLSAKGYNAQLVSVDKTMDPYENLKSALYENRLFYYEYPPLLEELQQLEFDRVKKKVDHPIRGRKDISDALAGCLWTLSQQRLFQPIPIMRGVAYDDGGDWGQAPPQENPQTTSAGLDGMLPPFLTSAGSGWDDGSDW